MPTTSNLPRWQKDFWAGAEHVRDILWDKVRLQDEQDFSQPFWEITCEKADTDGPVDRESVDAILSGKWSPFAVWQNKWRPINDFLGARNKNRAEMHFYRTGGENRGRSPPVSRSSRNAFLRDSCCEHPKSALKRDFASCRSAVPRLCDCISAAPSTV